VTYAGPYRHKGLSASYEKVTETIAAVRAAGFRFVALDLEGFRSGSLNRDVVSTANDAVASDRSEKSGTAPGGDL